MPRLPPSVLHHARLKNPLLPILLRECRDTRSAENELRWLKEHALRLQFPPNVRPKPRHMQNGSLVQGWRTTLRRLARRRARGEPLQYILGTQPFGDLEILCKKGVLIPRPETEMYTVTLAQSVLDLKRKERQKLRILDLCTGTGCIALLLHSLLRPVNSTGAVPKKAAETLPADAGLEILGVDISKTALRLAEKNLYHTLEQKSLHPSARYDVSFARADVLKSNAASNLANESGNGLHKADLGSVIASAWEVVQHRGLGGQWDILISNPPYISPRQFSPGGITMRSVRRWEPQLALVPRPLEFSVAQPAGLPEQGKPLLRGDEFYPQLLQLARLVDAKAVVLEVGDNEQAMRIQNLASHYFAGDLAVAVEVWRDDGSVETTTGDRACSHTESECRAVVVWRASWAKWRMDWMRCRSSGFEE